MSTLKADSIQPTNNGNNLIFKTGVGDAERMRIDTSGFVGIGTNSPAQLLHLKSTTPIIRIEDTDDSGAYSEIACNSAGGQAGSMVIRADHGGANANSFLRFDVNGTEKARIQANGRVGIGTASPAVALDVNGTIKTNTALVLSEATFAAPSGTAPLFGIRAWVTFCGNLDINGNDDSTNQGTGVVTTSYTTSPNRKIIASGNVSSVTLTRDPRALTKYATGVYTVNFTTPLPSSSTNFRTSPAYSRGQGAGMGPGITDADLYNDSRSPYYQKNGTPLGAYAVAGFSNEMYGNLWYGNYNYYTAGGFWDWNSFFPEKCIVLYNNEDTLGAAVPGNATLIFVG